MGQNGRNARQGGDFRLFGLRLRVGGLRVLDTHRPRRLGPRRGSGGAPATRARLTARAEVRRAVHERGSYDGSGAARARLALLSVDLQRPLEVPTLTVDVD